MLLGTSTFSRTVWRQKPDARESPLVCLSGTVWRSPSLHYKPRWSICPRRCGARTPPTMPTSWGTCHAKNVRRSRSWIYTSRMKHHPTSARTRATTRWWLPVHSNNPRPSSMAAMQWIITLIHPTVIQYTWRRRNRRTPWFELLTHR